MSKNIWKKGTILSIEARKNVFFLAQILESPYLYVFDTFNTSHDWKIQSLEDVEPMFCIGVVGQFIKASNIKKIDIEPRQALNFPLYWIENHSSARMYTIWNGTEDEMTFAMFETGGYLIKRDLHTKPQDYIRIQSIQNDDNGIIDNHETMGLRSYPELNERLYLCYLLGKKVDPLKELIFQRPMIKEYKVYMQITTGKKTQYY